MAPLACSTSMNGRHCFEHADLHLAEAIPGLFRSQGAAANVPAVCFRG